MDIAKRMTALFARRTGNEEAAAAVVKNLLNRKPETSSSEGSPMGRSPLMSPSAFGDTRESSPFGTSNALLDGMKFGGKKSSDLEFEKFIGSVGAPTISQAPPPPSDANVALREVTEALAAIGGGGAHFSSPGWNQHFRLVVRLATQETSFGEMSAENQKFFAEIAANMTAILKGDPNPEELERLTDELETKLLEITGKTFLQEE
jgi:hypothetical protein